VARCVGKAGKGIHAWHKLASYEAAYQPCQDIHKEKEPTLNQSTWSQAQVHTCLGDAMDPEV
jgi:hypothetical protein